MRATTSRALALLLSTSIMTAACTTVEYSSNSSKISAPDEPDSDDPDGDESIDWTAQNDEPWDDLAPKDYEAGPILEGELFEPRETCSYVSAEYPCADEALLEKLRAKEKALDDKRKVLLDRGAVLKTASKNIVTKMEINVSLGAKLAVVMVKGNRKDKIGAVPLDVYRQIKEKFTEANKDENGGWVFDETASNNEAGKQYMTQEELDRLVDATEKGAGDLLGMQARKLGADRYVVINKGRVVIFEYEASSSNPWTTTAVTPTIGLPVSSTWPDDHGRWNKFLKWLTEHRWRAFIQKSEAVIGTDPARTRDQMIDDAIARAIEEAKNKDNWLTWETIYSIVQVLPVTGTIDAIQRGDCPDAVASALTDAATLVGWWPAKVFRLGKLKVPATMLMIALDGAAITVRIAYNKDGAWIEAGVTMLFQARALKKAFGPILANARKRAALLGAAGAALSVACDDFDKAMADTIAAEDEVLKARDELDAARAELMKNLKIPCGDETDDPDADPTTDPTGTDDAVFTDPGTCADSFDGTLTDAYRLAGSARTMELEPSDAETETAIRELGTAFDQLEVAVTSGPLDVVGTCTLAEDVVEPLAETLASVETTEEPLIIAQTQEVRFQITDEQPITQEPAPQQPVPQPMPQQPAPQQPAPQQPVPQPPVVCPAPAPHPSVKDLADRYAKAAETVKKMQAVLGAKRAEAERTLSTSLIVTLAAMYGVGTDTIEKILDAHVKFVMDYLAKNKIAWNSDIERDTRLTYLVVLAGYAIDDKRLEDKPNGAQVQMTGQQKTDQIAKLKKYREDYLTLRGAEGDNMLWPIRKGAVALVSVISALPTIEEWVKNCTPITPEMLAKIGFPSKGKEPFTIDAQRWADYLRTVEEALAKYEAAVAKAAKAVLGDEPKK